jgi:hypothetical protein
MTIKAAYFTNGTKKVAPTLRFATIENGRCIFTHQMMVEGKREARKVAEAAGYKPWNF